MSAPVSPALNPPQGFARFPWRSQRRPLRRSQRRPQKWLGLQLSVPTLLSTLLLGTLTAPAWGQATVPGSAAAPIGAFIGAFNRGEHRSLIAQTRVTPAERQRYEEPGERDPRFILDPRDPLNPVATDPLLPANLGSRSLSPLEQQNFQANLEALNTEAELALEAGDDPTAFILWFRLLRLQQFFPDPLSEMERLGEVGERAWTQGRSEWVVTITDRLAALEAAYLGSSSLETPGTSTTPGTPAPANPVVTDRSRAELQAALARAYGQVRALPQATALYQDLLSTARDRQDLTAQVLTLAQISQLQAGALEPIAAAQTTETLLALLQANPQLDLRPLRLWRTPPAAGAPTPRLNPAKVRLQEEQRLWEDRAVFWDLAQDWGAALQAQRDLAVFYGRAAGVEPELALKIPETGVKQAQYQVLLGDQEGAIATYRQAYGQAQTLKLYEVAREILQDLIGLYRQAGDLDQVLALYRNLLKTNQIADDAYGMVAAYQDLGLFYQEYASPEAAIEVLRRALGIAERLQFRVEEIQAQIEVIETPLESQLAGARAQAEAEDFAGAIAAYDHLYDLAQRFQRRDLQQQVLWDRLTLYQGVLGGDPAIITEILQAVTGPAALEPPVTPFPAGEPSSAPSPQDPASALLDLTLATYNQLLDLYRQEQNSPALLETYQHLGAFYLQNSDLQQHRSLARSNLQQALALVEQLLYFSPQQPENPDSLAQQLKDLQGQIREIDRSLKRSPELNEADAK